MQTEDPNVILRRAINGKLLICERKKIVRHQSRYFVADRFGNVLFNSGRYGKAVTWAKEHRQKERMREGQDCPRCPNQGWYMVPDHRGDPEPTQCEFCCTNPMSKFNLEQQAKTA
jgi:hypothetical protein